MLANVISGAVLGIEAYRVNVEVDLGRGMVVFNTVGLPGSAVCESKIRVRSALNNCGYGFPARRVTVNLSPGNIRKEGTAFDLPMALGILAADGQIPRAPLENTLIAGELSLDGSVLPIRGVLPLAAHARESGLSRLLVPQENVMEASVVQGIDVYGISHLEQAVKSFKGEESLTVTPTTEVNVTDDFSQNDAIDMRDVKGQPMARRALEIAAAGGHNMIFIGPPGSGKTMLARRLPTIVPPMTFDEQLESSVIASVAGLLKSEQPLITERPFRAPHHSVSDVALIGGGSLARPGEVSLAHNGVLFLDEMPEFRRTALEALRQPLEDGMVVVARAQATLTYPSRFMLVAAMNPCPCGYYGHPRHRCQCTPQAVSQYRNRISGPLMDRIDLQLNVEAVPPSRLRQLEEEEDSASIRQRVIAARALQSKRLAGSGAHCNAQLLPSQIHEFCALDPRTSAIFEDILERFDLSGRAHDRILRVARTIADLGGSDRIEGEHLREAIQYRQLDKEKLG